MDEAGFTKRLETPGRDNRKLNSFALGTLILAVLLITVGEAGCPFERSKQKSAAPQATHIEQPYQRFVRIVTVPSMALNWALDTKTGEVCRTWDWRLPGDELGKNGEADISLAAPTCLTLYQEYPDK